MRGKGPSFFMPYADYKHCDHCGEEYFADKPSRKYCSKECFAAERWSVYDPYILEWRRQYLDGDAYKTIGERYGKGANVIRGALQVNGIPPRNRWDKALSLGLFAGEA